MQRLKWYCCVKMLQGHCTTKSKDWKSRARPKKYTASSVTIVRYRRTLFKKRIEILSKCQIWLLPVMHSTPLQRPLEMLCHPLWFDVLVERVAGCGARVELLKCVVVAVIVVVTVLVVVEAVAWLIDWLRYGFTLHPTQNRSLRHLSLVFHRQFIYCLTQF